MRVQVFSAEAVDDVAEAVRLLVEVGCIDLAHVTGQDDFAVFPSACDDGLHFVRRQVLRFIDDEDGVGQRPAADVGEGANGDFLLGLEFLNDAALAFVLPELGFDENLGCPTAAACRG